MLETSKLRHFTSFSDKELGMWNITTADKIWKYSKPKQLRTKDVSLRIW